MLVAGLVLLALPAPSGAVTFYGQNPDGTETRAPMPYQRWANAAKVPTVNGRVILHTDGCVGLFACGSTREVWVLGSWMTVGDREDRRSGRAEVRDALMHELGHVFDYDRLTDARRNWLRRLMRTRRPWRAIEGSNTVAADETFAEAYMLCARRKVDWEEWDGGGEYLYNPTRRQHRKVCRYLRKL